MAAFLHHLKGVNSHMKLTYYRNGDYLLPDLAVNETDQQPLGKYGMLRLHFLQVHRPVLMSFMKPA